MTKKLTPVLTPQELNAIASAANRVWEECAYDVLEDGKSIPRSHVLEIVLDADRFFQRLTSDKTYQASAALQTLFKDRYDDRPMMDWLKSHLKKNVFVYSRYGL